MAREMKDSGIEWIGELPKDWKIIKYKHTHSVSNVGEAIDKAFWSTDKEDRLFYTAQIRPIRTSYNNFPDLKYTTNFDILLARNATPYVYLPLSGAIYTDHIIRTTIYREYDRRYIRYCLQNSIKSVIVAGVSIPTWSISIWDNQILPCPLLAEQQRIADFLDTQCAHIDSVIEKTRAAIEEYKKLKQAVITQAVTKGIRPNREMKDSGIDWIGEIPKEWQCVKFKYIAKVKANLVHPDDYKDYLQVSPENIEKGTGKLLSCKTVEEVGVISDNHLFYKGQLLYSKIRPILNKVTIAPFDGLCSADMYPIETSINKYYLLYALLSDSFLVNISLITEDRVKMPKINQEELNNIFFMVPSDNEQSEIVAYLDEKTAAIDSLIQKKEHLITELEAYKKSLIYEYVTGKKEAPAHAH